MKAPIAVVSCLLYASKSKHFSQVRYDPTYSLTQVSLTQL